MKPRLTIVTSVYNGNDFIQPFLDDMIQMHGYEECQHLIINANSPDHEGPAIRKFIAFHTNAHYIDMTCDPGLYRIWNMAIQIADAPYVTNANIDDRRSKYFIHDSVEFLDQHPKIDVVSAPVFVTRIPNETFDQNKAYDLWYSKFRGEYRKEDLFMYDKFGGIVGSMNVPHSNPVWRKKIHRKAGYFDETFTPFSDWEFWIRCASKDARFWNLERPLSLYYHNPKGLSTDKQKEEERDRLMHRILALYT